MVVFYCGAEASAGWAASAQEQEQATLPLASTLWALHQRACRVVHSLAAADSRWLAVERCMTLLMSGTSLVHATARSAAAAYPDGGSAAR
ncbi:hypothetical protein ABPG75_005896 [Micractinium tetrahymenae]